MIDTPTVIPNHHGQDPPFRGFKEYLAAATMIFGRGGDARLAERLSELKADDAVVDVGCGPGTAVRHAATLASTVVGVDPAPEELRVARLLTRLSEIRYSRTRNSERVRYLPGTAEEIRPKDQGAKHPRTGGRFAPQSSAR